MRKSRLSVGADLFVRIKSAIAAAEASGRKLIPLAVGQPTGAAFLEARRAAAVAVMSEAEAMHQYQDVWSPGVPNFAERFVQTHVKTKLARQSVDFLPIPGIKSILKTVIIASRCSSERLKVRTMTAPGYGVPATWCKGHFRDFITHTEVSLNPRNRFLFDPSFDLENLTHGLLMLNYPHAPSGQIASQEWLWRVCRFCEAQNIRIFNDAAYTALVHAPKNHSTLTDVAVEFPNLSWAEAFSASKALGNTTGWRIGAVAGSPDFVDDVRTVKSSDDAGFVAFAAAGVIEGFEKYAHLIEANRKVYARRLRLLIKCLRSKGMRLAVQPKAGFFTLWLTPKRAFGRDIASAEDFNFLMLQRTRIFGVHFPPYLRYAVVGDVEAALPEIGAAFEAAKVAY
ncbi:MAG: aminotransferase class I/II-fold pyridoxal phosphate-dependent enzyme [Candidatus Liptonbacteria bacterium]|nr:aminotransferase class I/II-fold pyridoxal phosphate-dependent enzyme [Candidatus Liptonbacteria bacterium]